MSTNLSGRSLKGLWTAIATPFVSDGSRVDRQSLERLIEFQVDARVDGLVVCGSTGEGQTLSDEEYLDLLRMAQAAVKGRLPLIAGIGAISTGRAVECAQNIARLDYDGALLVAPPYVKPTQQGIIEHYKAVAAVSPPLCAYNIPGRSSCRILPETIERLSRAGAIIGVKDASGSLDNVLEMHERCGESLAILSGEDTLVHAVIACGGKGVISASANIAAQEFGELCSAALRGSFAESLAIQIKLLPIVRALFAETNPIPVKAALKMKGIFSSDYVRLPLTKASESTLKALSTVIN